MFPTGHTPRCLSLAQRFKQSLAAVLCCALTLAPLSATPSFAQFDVVSRDLYTERPRNEGNTISFCLRPLGPLAAFEAELADKIGQMLLTNVRKFTLNVRQFPVRPSIYDYIFGLTDDQMFIMMAQNCDVVLGMHLTAGGATWLRLSRPYIVADMLAVSRDKNIRSLDDLKAGHRIGTQAMAAGDAGLVSHLKSLAEDQVPERVIFRTNHDLFTALDSGTLDAALIWEGALLAGTEGNPEGYYRLGRLPFPTDKILVSAAVRLEDTTLGVMLDEAIGALEANGTLHEMAVRHHIIWDQQP